MSQEQNRSDRDAWMWANSVWLPFRVRIQSHQTVSLVPQSPPFKELLQILLTGSYVPDQLGQDSNSEKGLPKVSSSALWNEWVSFLSGCGRHFTFIHYFIWSAHYCQVQQALLSSVFRWGSWVWRWLKDCSSRVIEMVRRMHWDWNPGLLTPNCVLFSL